VVEMEAQGILIQKVRLSENNLLIYHINIIQ